MEHEKFLEDTCRAVCALGAFVLIAGTSAAFAQTPAASADKSAAKGSPTPSSIDKKPPMMPGMPGMAAGADMHGSMMSMVKSMESLKMTGDTDRDFATMMKVHHQGAIDMAQMQLQKGKDAKMHAMAKEIIKAQQKEIKEFDQWLAKRK